MAQPESWLCADSSHALGCAVKHTRMGGVAMGESVSAQCVSIRLINNQQFVKVVILWGTFCGCSGCSSQHTTSMGTGNPQGKRRRCTGHTASDMAWYDKDCANAREGGCRGGAAPPELSNSIGCRSSLQRPGCRLRNG